MAAAWSEIVENLPEGLIVSASNPRDCRVLYLNTEATRMFGYARQEIVNRSIRNLLPEFVDPGAEERKGHALMGRRRDGATFRVHVRHAAIPDAAVSAVILRLRDLSNSARPAGGAHDSTRDLVEVGRVADALCGLRESLRPLCCRGNAHARTPACIINRMLATLNEEIRAVPSVARMTSRPRSGPPIRVLHIEDDESVRRAMGRILRLKGCEVFGAATREQAMHYFEEEGWRPDLILADFQLAHGATSEPIVAEIAVRLGSKPPTIVLTGATDRRAEVAIKSFADRVLTKPVEVRVLLDEFAVALEQRA
jgi:PAS domain S-box-containing protein